VDRQGRNGQNSSAGREMGGFLLATAVHNSGASIENWRNVKVVEDGWMMNVGVNGGALSVQLVDAIQGRSKTGKAAGWL